MSQVNDELNTNELTIRNYADGFSYIVINSDKHTLVPAALYLESKKSKYLDFIGIRDDNSVVCADYIELADIYNVYCVSKKEHAKLKDIENSEFRHASTLLLEDLIKENHERTDDSRVYLNVKNNSFEMVVLKGAKLLFDNVFRFKTKEDFLYFVLFSMEQLNIDVEITPVYFMGMIEKDSQIVELVTRYIRDVRFKTEKI